MILIPAHTPSSHAFPLTPSLRNTSRAGAGRLMVFDPSMASIAEIGISIKRAGLSPAPGPVKPAHVSSGFRLQVSFRAVFGWAATVMPSLSYQCARPLYVERINVSVQASPCGTTRFYAATPLPLRNVPRSSLLPTPTDQHTTPPTLTPALITPVGMGCRQRPGPAGSPGRILVRTPGVGVRVGVGR